jgi:hypothetical protein
VEQPGFANQDIHQLIVHADELYDNETLADMPESDGFYEHSPL